MSWLCCVTSLWRVYRVTSLPCDELTAWRVDRVKSWPREELTAWRCRPRDELTAWRVDRVTSWPRDELTTWRVDCKPEVIITSYLNHTFYYGTPKYSFFAGIANIWNSLCKSVVGVDTVCLFRAHLDKFWLHRDVKYDFTANPTGIGDKLVHEISGLF